MGIVRTTTNFNGTELSGLTGVTVLATDSYLIPKRTLTMADVSRTNQAKVSSAFFTGKTITIRLGISALTRDLVETYLDNVINAVAPLEKALILREGGELRSYTATLSDGVRRVDGGSYIEMDFVFETSDHYGYAIPYEKLLDATGRTLYNYTDTLVFGGGADTQAPIITAFLSAIGAGTSNTVTIGNVATGRYIVVNRAWTAGDRLVIDCQNKTVKVNGALVDFTGAFPEFAPGNGYLNYNDTFSTRTLALSAYYYRRYLWYG